MIGPIFNRELLTIPRRRQHYFSRSLYLLFLWILMLTCWQTTVGWGRKVSHKELADFSALTFQLLSIFQLVMVLFFSSLSAASAVAQEKDRRTFVLLLTTDLRNYEIVLGKTLGSLLHIGVLILSALPILALLMLLGGVSLQQVLLTFLVLFSSAIASASLGSLIALWRDKTFQSLALTVLLLVLFILIVEGLVLFPVISGVSVSQIETLQVRLNPFRALSTIVAPSSHEMLVRNPAYEYGITMAAIAVVLNFAGILYLRVWNPSGEPIMQRDAPEDKPSASVEGRNVHSAPGKVRPVWANPVLWREIMTRAYGRRPLLVKLAFLIVFGLIAFSVYQSAPIGGAKAVNRLFVAMGLVPVTVLSLLLLNAQSVTSITSERDLNAFDLLLVTDVTPTEFVFGKLGGIFWNVKEIILPAIAFVLGYTFLGWITIEQTAYILLALFVMMVFTAVLGIHVAMYTVNTRVAIGYSLGTIFFLFVGTLLCIYLLLVSGRFEAQWTSFIMFLAIGIGGLYFVIGSYRPSVALSISSWICPLGIFYSVTNLLVENLATGKAGDPLYSFLVVIASFGFTVAAMMVPMLSEFDVAMGYSLPPEE